MSSAPILHANSKKTHCLRGHEYDRSNTYVAKSGARSCRRCRSERYQHRGRTENLAQPDLDAKALARLRDARADGVSIEDLAARFGRPQAYILAALNNETRAEP